MPSLQMVYDIISRDGASPAFRTVAAEAKNLQRVMQEADAKMTAASKAATAEISASLAGLDRAHNAAALQYDRANQTMIKSDDSLIVMQRKMAASTGALLAEQKKAAAANVEMDAAMGKAQADLAAKTEASRASRVSAFKDLGKASAAALLIVGYESVKAATKFEASMARVQTMAGASAKELKFMSGAILDLSPKVGVGPDALAESLYHVESAGFRGQKALDMVTASAKLSALGQDDINSSTQAVVATLASNIKGVRDANDAAALILHTVGTGDMTMHQFTQALGTGILATASTVGLAFKDIGAAIATLTDNAIPADQAATKLRTSLLMMVNPSGPAIAALRSINMNSTQLAMDLQKPDGLKVALDDIRKHLNSAFPLNKGPVASIDAQRRAVDSYKTTLMGAGVSGKELDKMVAKYTEALKHGTTNTVLQEQAFAKMFGGSKNAGTMMVLFNEQLDRMNPKLASFGTATSRAAEMQAAWAKQQSTFKQQLKDLNSALDTAKVKIGNELLPVLKTMVGFLSHHLGVIKDLSVAVGIMATAWVAYTAAVSISSLIRTLTAAQWSLNAAMDANPIGVVIIGLAALAFAAYELITHWKAVTAFTKRMWHDVAGFFERMWHDVAGFFERMWHDVAGFADRIAADVNGFFARMWKDTTGFVSRMWHDVTGFFARMWKDITGFADRIANDVDGFFNRMGDGIRKVLDHIGRFFHDHWRLLLTAATLGLGLIYIVIQDHWKQITGLAADLWRAVTGWMTRMWNDIVAAFKIAVAVVWNIIKPFVDLIIFGFKLLWQVTNEFVTRLWHDIFGTTQTATTHVAKMVSDHAVKVEGFFGGLWRAVTGWMSRMWHDIVGFFTAGFATVAAILAPFIARVIGGWQRIYDVSAVIVKTLWHDVTGFFGSMRDGVVGIFDDMVGKIGRVWDRVKELVAVPIRWVIENPYDKGILPMIQGIGGILHEPSMTSLTPPPHFASGGKIPGSHSRDDVPFYGTPGELVVPLPVVDRFGGADALMSALGFGGGGGAGGHYGFGGVIGDIGHGIGSAAGAVGSAAGAVGHAIAHPLDTLKNLVQGSLGSVAGPIIHGLESAADGVLGGMGGVGADMARMVHVIGDKLLSLITGKDSAYNAAKTAAAASHGGGSYGGTPGAAGGAGRWAGTVLQALGMLGQPAAMVAGVLSLINNESGGNPNAINLWDSNAKAGYPSRGLMQAIPQTFERWRSMSLPDNIVDPLANVYAGINYALHTYGPGMLLAGGRHSSGGGYLGYDTGGILPSGRVGINRSGQPERILSPSQTAAFERLVAQLEGSRGMHRLHQGTLHITPVLTAFLAQIGVQIGHHVRAGVAAAMRAHHAHRTHHGGHTAHHTHVRHLAHVGTQLTAAMRAHHAHRTHHTAQHHHRTHHTAQHHQAPHRHRHLTHLTQQLTAAMRKHIAAIVTASQATAAAAAAIVETQKQNWTNLASTTAGNVGALGLSDLTPAALTATNPKTGGQYMLAQAIQQTQQRRSFDHLLLLLSKRGLNSAMLTQISSMTPDQGMFVAQSLLSAPNIISGINAQYGMINHLSSVVGTGFANNVFGAYGRPRGYDSGGMLPSGGFGVNRSDRPERVLSPGQTASFDRLVKVLERGGGQGRGPLVGTVHVHDNVGLDLVLRQAQFREHAGYL